jgi:hypothetical protein
MKLRSLLLLVLLIVLGLYAFNLHRGAGSDAAPAPAASTAATLPAAPRTTAFRTAQIDDAAGILAPFGSKLDAMTTGLRDDVGIDVRIVTTTAATASIEEQADRIFRESGIGAAAPTGGILVLLNPGLGRARIEVGYSLEGGLTDLQMGRIARDQLSPYVSYGVAGMAVMDVLHQLRDLVYLAAARGDITLGEQYSSRPAYQEFRGFLSGGAGAQTKLSQLPVDADLKQRVEGNRRVRYAPASTPAGSVQALRTSAGVDALRHRGPRRPCGGDQPEARERFRAHSAAP